MGFVFDCTDVVLVGGENSCEATKNVAHLNKAIFKPMQNAPVYGKKIDLMLRYDGNRKIELSSNEWKRSKFQEDLKLKQQSKNLRTNAVILDHLNCHCSTDDGKTFLVDTTKILKQAIFQKEINQLIPGLPAPKSVSRRLSHAYTGHIYLAPKANQTKKTDLNDSSYDE